MIKPRLFRYRISGIVLNPEEKIFSCFMHFSIGGLEKEVTTEYSVNIFGSACCNSDVLLHCVCCQLVPLFGVSEVIKKLVKRKFKKDKDSPEEEIETEKEYQRKENQAVKPIAGHHYTWMKIADAKKDSMLFFKCSQYRSIHSCVKFVPFSSLRG